MAVGEEQKELGFKPTSNLVLTCKSLYFDALRMKSPLSKTPASSTVTCLADISATTYNTKKTWSFRLHLHFIIVPGVHLVPLQQEYSSELNPLPHLPAPLALFAPSATRQAPQCARSPNQGN